MSKGLLVTTGARPLQREAASAQPDVIRLDLTPAQQQRIMEGSGLQLRSITFGRRQLAGLSLAAAAAGRDFLPCARSAQTLQRLLHGGPGSAAPFVVEVALEDDQAARIEAVTHRRLGVLVIATEALPPAAPRESALDETRQLANFLVMTRTSPVPAVVEADGIIALPRPAPGGSAFDTGRHPATHIGLVLMESAVRHGDRVLELRPGAGILAVAAARIGAQAVDAVVGNAASAAVTLETVRLNALESTVHVIERVPDGRRYDCVIANMSPRRLLSAAPALARLLTDGGSVLVPGVHENHEDDVLRALAQQGLELDARRRIASWIGFLLSGPRAEPR